MATSDITRRNGAETGAGVGEEGAGESLLGSSADPPARQAGGERRRRRVRLPRSVISVVVGFLIWEVLVRVSGVSSLIIVGPSAILAEFWELVSTGELWRHFRISMVAFVIGYGVSAALGILLGLAMGANRFLRDYLDPWVSGLYATPSVSLAPLFIVWLGFGVASKVGIVALVAFFPVIINTLAGVLAVDRDLREVGIAYRATRTETFVHVLLPGSLPYILTGLRLAVGRGLVGVVVADLFGASAGLGFLIVNAASVFNTARIFVATIILALLGVALSALIQAVERRTVTWRFE